MVALEPQGRVREEGKRAWLGLSLSSVSSAWWTLVVQLSAPPSTRARLLAGPRRPLVLAWLVAAQLGDSRLCEGRFCPICPALLPTRDK